MNGKRLLLLIGLASSSAVTSSTTSALELVPHRARTKPACLDCIPSRDYQYRPRSATVTVVSRRAQLLAVATVDTEAFLRKEAEARGETVSPAPSSQSVPTRPVAPDTLPPPREASGHAEELELTPALVSPMQFLSGARPPLRFEARPDAAPVAARVRPAAATATAASTASPVITRLYQLDRPTLAIDQCEISQVALQLRSNGTWVLSLRADQNRRPADPATAGYNPKLHIKRNEFNLQLRCLGSFSIPVTSTSPAAGQPVLAAIVPEPFWVENGQPRYIRAVGCDCELAAALDKVDRVELEFFYR